MTLNSGDSNELAQVILKSTLEPIGEYPLVEKVTVPEGVTKASDPSLFATLDIGSPEAGISKS